MLDRLKQQLRKWFPPGKQDSSEAVVQEMLVRTHRQKQLFKTWIQEGRQHEVLKNIYTSYTLNKSGISGDVPMHVLLSGQHRQVIIHYLDVMGKHVFPFLQDYFRDRIMRMGYNLYLSDRQIIQRASHTETIDRHILRPYVPAVHLSDKPEQLYGVISVIVHRVNERPLYIQILAEAQHDPNLGEVFPFDELAEILFI
jgi:hypothetical protein